MFGFLKTLKNKGRRYLFGNRGKWNAHGATRRLNNGSSAKRTLLGRIKNKAGDFLFGTRKNRKLPGKLKNSLEAFIEERIPWLGLTKSRQHELTQNESNAISVQQAAHEAALAAGAVGVGLKAQPNSPRAAAAATPRRAASGSAARAAEAADIFPGLRSERGGMVWYVNPLIQARSARAGQAPFGAGISGPKVRRLVANIERSMTRGHRK